MTRDGTTNRQQFLSDFHIASSIFIIALCTTFIYVSLHSHTFSSSFILFLFLVRTKMLEVKVIFGKLDKNQDGMIDLREWVSVLFDLFRFMAAPAFEKHCAELIAIIQNSQQQQQQQGSASQATPAQ